MTNDALKPCPFCGGDADIDEFEGKLLETVFAASCNNDDCPIGHKDHGSWPTKTDALNSWNKRAALAPVDVDYFGSLVEKSRLSAQKACVKFPQPNYVTLKIAEEAGEVIRAAVHYAEGRMSWNEVEGEIVQLLAMLIRLVTEGDEINGVKPPDIRAARGCFWGWQPIETAPKDGTWIMVYWPTMGIGQYPFVVFWDEGWQPARYSDRDYGEAFPTHWMPLPAAPKKEE